MPGASRVCARDARHVEEVGRTYGSSRGDGQLAGRHAHAATSIRSAARRSAARARGVARDLVLGGPLRLLRQDRDAARPHGSLASTIRSSERVVGDHDHAATGSEEFDRPRQGGGELLDLPIDRDTERLEGATRGVGAPRPLPERTRDDAGELIGRRDRPLPHDGAGDPTGAMLAAVLVDQVRELGFGELVDQVGRGEGVGFGPTHAHVRAGRRCGSRTRARRCPAASS